LYSFALFRYRFDVIQVNQFPFFHIPILKAYCMLTGCKMIIDVVEVWDRPYWIQYLASKSWGPLANAFADWTLRMGDAYIANSSTTADNLSRLGIDRRVIKVFSPVVDDTMIRSVKASKRQNAIIFSGRLIKEKRFDKWLSVVKEASKKMPSLKAILIGEGPESSNIKRMITNYGLQKNVEFRKFYPEKRVKELYSAIKSAGLLLNMSEREGLSIIGLQSLALGTPVVLPDYSPIPKEVKEMCVVESERDIADAVVKILRSNSKRQFIRNIDKLKAFSKSNVGDFYDDMFKRLGVK
ncbi:MAG: glycosyltransferase family 4 protein, partial [Candidatus Micrarchaeaceae archaeon]